MKKIGLIFALLGLAAVPMAANAQAVLGTAPLTICQDGKLGTDGTNPMLADDAVTDTTQLLFIKKRWTPGCSNNVVMGAGEVMGWVVMSAASKKGKYYFGGNTEGLAPVCVKDDKTSPKCSETATNLVDPTKTVADMVTSVVGFLGSLKGTTSAEPWSPCWWADDAATKAGCI